MKKLILERYPYREEKTVEERECFPNLKMDMRSILTLVQRVSTEHLNTLGIDYEKLFKENIVFMLSSSSTKIWRNPVLGENITAATCPALSKGAHMMRETVIADENNNIIAENQASWVMIDPSSQKLIKPREFPYELPVLENYEPFKEVWRMKFPKEGSIIEERKVRLSDLDRNNHMNNTVYASLMTDCLGLRAQEGIGEISIKYKKQAKLGDILKIRCMEENDTVYFNAEKDDILYFQGSVVLDKIN